MLAGVLIALGMLAGKNAYFASLSLSGRAREYAGDYYNLILIYLAMGPLSALLDNMLMFLIGVALSLLTVLFAPLLIRGFGIAEPALLRQGTVMMRYMGLSFAFQSLATFYFLYAFLMRKNALALLVVGVNEFAAPVALALLGATPTHTPTRLWIGIALAPAVGFPLSLLAALMLYGRENFPWLVSGKRDEQIKCFDFEITDENAVALSETLVGLFHEQGYSPRTGSLAGMLAEDILLLIREKNPPGKKLFAECNVIFEEGEARVILRDSGLVFDVTSCDGTQSIREYIVAQTLNLPEHKFYISTTGYNRNELLLVFQDKGEALHEEVKQDG